MHAVNVVVAIAIAHAAKIQCTRAGCREIVICYVFLLAGNNFSVTKEPIIIDLLYGTLGAESGVPRALGLHEKSVLRNLEINDK